MIINNKYKFNQDFRLKIYTFVDGVGDYEYEHQFYENNIITIDGFDNENKNIDISFNSTYINDWGLININILETLLLNKIITEVIDD